MFKVVLKDENVFPLECTAPSEHEALAGVSAANAFLYSRSDFNFTLFFLVRLVVEVRKNDVFVTC